MAFQLVISEGKEAGREFVFEQPSIVIGRTEECDVVLYDPGVSRKHARIFADGALYFVEDMGSSNGTKVNGAIIKRRQLEDGDAVALGSVVFSFTQVATEAGDEGGEEDEAAGAADQGSADVSADVELSEGAPAAVSPEVADQHTRIVSVEDVKRRRSTVVPLAQNGAMPSPALPARRSSVEANTYRGPPPSLARSRAMTSAAREPGALSAAERARLRRDAGDVGGGLLIFWRQAGGLVRGLITAFGALVGLSAIGAVYYFVLAPVDTRPKLPPEPTELTRQPIEHSFGVGPGVDYRRADQKLFEFEYNAPVRAVVILHFQSRDISQGEVIVSINATDVSAVPPDTLAANERSHEIIVPPGLLKKGQKNTALFDNTKNPPNEESWRIWNVWLELTLLPELPPEQLVRDATVKFQHGLESFERKDVGAVNRYQAWRDFRDTWLMLEAHPDPKPELYLLARDKVKEAQQELDRLCRTLLLEAEKYYNLKRFADARSTMEHVRQYFPASDQPCPMRAAQKMAEYGL